ncbi:MAG: hypothetical protein PHU85_16785 [Phycisphaerae bacterium]|nr:hypothetical protein [Phycisphaerae bacterium]
MDTFGLIGLKRNRSVDRLTANLLGAYGAMTVDSNADGVVDGFTQTFSNCAAVFALEGGQKITLASVTSGSAYAQVIITDPVAVSPGTLYACSVDAALVRSTAETMNFYCLWYTAAHALISSSGLTGVNPGATYARQSFTATSPATAAEAKILGRIRASVVGDTGTAWFKDALFIPT